ncbi:hypothetical protein LCGC14_0341280 [marine sediment metagenome]|uniref:Uncharacterized protein n=1 Tax=marine sediment metagenome TaxID=412755 RepID=A0A0F9W116_9ZZZZ
MEVYRLTTRGQQLAHSYRAARTPAWSIIFFLSKRHMATKEQILANVPDATSMTLTKLKYKRIVTEETGVDV